MTTTTDSFEPPVLRRRPSALVRFGVAFLIGLIAALALGVGALYAYDQQYNGRILPGVRLGDVDLSGLSPADARATLERQYAYLGEGAIILTAGARQFTIAYASVGRRADLDGMVADALAVGRSGNAVERVIADARTALRGAALEPRLTFDANVVASIVSRHAASLRIDPQDASVTTVKKGFELTPSTDGRHSDPTPAIAAILASIGSLDAPDRIDVRLPVETIVPAITTSEASSAKFDAERISRAVVLTDGKDEWPITSPRIRSWVSFEPSADGGYAAKVDTTDLAKVVKTLKTKMDRSPRNASFTTSGSRITGVIPSRQGRTLDVTGTTARIEAVLADRADGAAIAKVTAKFAKTDPILTTSQARAVIPKMRRISGWTTYFPIGEKNGFGVNIWIPTRKIDGYVVAPGAVFDFWKAVGPVTRQAGYKDGGAIINGRTEPQGALAGGICSCSTTLFNAALRAGYEMGARRNHFYYIDRYPLGLDATVFISSSGSTQTMSFTNDTRYPVLIRGYEIRDGSAGYVRFELWSVPTGRKVRFSAPTVRNIRIATDTIQYTSTLPEGTSKRIEYPVDGKQVWVTRTVTNTRTGAVIHKETYYSNYARITGITLVGR
ncbi:MAG: VanW family protein [Chloroflexi bacterium]|nr:VanW family protein [Chloroflexota bacterium]